VAGLTRSDLLELSSFGSKEEALHSVYKIWKLPQQGFIKTLRGNRGTTRFPLIAKDEGIAHQALKWAMSGAGLKIVLCL
jgi:hypothetical protein